ncbi:MAG: hypothetical protein AMDU1_APLC00043G0030 [Thermoplasmatales archaeon A-plasma]|nr:MAG: hypothetical protein AMDU1_APLC00043G0030 [Thermoplasmatales archaeon A-plasma]
MQNKFYGMGTMEKAMVYVRFTKPKVWGLLVFVGAMSAIIAIPTFNFGYLSLLTAVIVALAAGSAGAESLTNYLDRDIDSRMLRTNRRPMVTGAVTPTSALVNGSVLIVISIAIPLAMNRFIAAGFMAAGVADKCARLQLSSQTEDPVERNIRRILRRHTCTGRMVHDLHCFFVHSLVPLLTGDCMDTYPYLESCIHVP